MRFFRLLARVSVTFVTLLTMAMPATVAPAQEAPPASQAQVQAGNAESGESYTLPPEKLAKAIALSRFRNIMDIAGSLWGIAVAWLLLATGAAAGLGRWAERVFHSRWLQGLLFFAALIVILTFAGLPLDALSHHMSRSYGISVQGWGSWLDDQGKTLLLTIILGSLVMLLFQWIVRVSPRRYWLWCWVITLPLIVASTLAEPLLEPLFNRYEPLSKHHEALVAKLEEVVARTGTNIPPSRMFLMKASEKSNGLNAYVTGVGATKRYVMWDTATDRLPDDEIMFIFGHESGHYVLNHIPKMLAGFALGLFFIYWACAKYAGWLARRRGAQWGLPEEHALASRAGFVVLLFAISVAGLIIEPAANTFSRHFEHEADVYGQEAIHGLVPDPQQTAVKGFNALGEAWLEDPNPNPLIEFWEYSHPSVKNRANFAAHYDPWANGGHGRFFEH